jgi:hypothetical protein
MLHQVQLVKRIFGEWSLISVRINTSTGDYVEYLSNGSIQGSQSSLANGSTTSSSHSLNLSSNFGYFVHDDTYQPNVTSFTVSPTEFTEGVATNIQITISATEGLWLKCLWRSVKIWNILKTKEWW